MNGRGVAAVSQRIGWFVFERLGEVSEGRKPFVVECREKLTEGGQRWSNVSPELYFLAYPAQERESSEDLEVSLKGQVREIPVEGFSLFRK